jgi:ribosomal-protein-alanine N-acetyltransferase
MVFPILATKRLTLRQLDDNDHKEIFALRSDDNVNQYISRRRATNIDEAKEFIKNINKNRSLYWAICFNDSKKLIGTICLWNLSEDKTRAEVGYELNPAYQKMGVMNEALDSVLNYGFNEIQLKTIVACTHKDNTNSSRLLEKNNFKIDEFLKDEDDPNNVNFCLTAEKYAEVKS